MELKIAGYFTRLSISLTITPPPTTKLEVYYLVPGTP